MTSHATATIVSPALGPECPAEPSRPSPGRGLRSAKIQAWHWERTALVYVRQSSPQQVVEHPESRARQYALADHAIALGWPKERVMVIDEDQGQSGRSAEQRSGFQRLLAEVGMDHVGIILGLEMSRLARSSKDWHHLLEWCAVFGTLLADQDGIYNPNDSNDRLLLGLKGTMSEFELVTMRNRLQRGALHKAQRGELFIGLPFGYVQLPSGQVVLEPDEQARAVVQLIFEKFDELGSVHALMHYLVRQGIRLGIRARRGPRQGELEWHRPSLPTLAQLLHHPMYAGAYVFGRRGRARPSPTAPGRPGQRRWLPMDQWLVLKRDHLPAYITWEHYLANQERLRQNRSFVGCRGVPRDGAALLGGLLICGTCGRHLQASYSDPKQPCYCCNRHLVKAENRICWGLNAAVIDNLVAQQVLRALEPAALELSLQALADVHKERERLQRHWQKRLERARYDAQRAERHYHAVEPENRLVARTLEQRWEEALRTLRQLEDEHDRFLQEKPLQVTEEEQARIRALSEDIPALWRAAGTTNADRKAIVRCLVERVVVHVRPDSEYVDATIHWHGGFTSQHEIVRPVRSYAQLRDQEQLVARVVQLHGQGHTAAALAEQLNHEGFAPPRRSGRFNQQVVKYLLARCGLPEKTAADQLGPHEWWLADLARALHMPINTLRDWLAHDWVHRRQTPAQGRWIAWADRDELTRLRQLQARCRRGQVAYPPALTTPKEKAEK